MISNEAHCWLFMLNICNILYLQEKDDIESKFKDLSEAVEKASSEKLLLQQELDRARQSAADALRSMDVDRQQIRTANSKYFSMPAKNLVS